MKKNPKVSVLIPNYNYGRFLGEAIESVLNQTYSDYELTIVDNNSTDNTDEVVQKYLHDSRIRYYKNPTNIGLTGNFNKCLEYASGEYIKYLLSDDKFHPELLAKFVNIMDEYKDVILVTSNSEYFGLESRTRESPLKYLQKGETVIEEIIRSGKGNFIGEATTVMFRASYLQNGNFNPKYTGLIDLDLWLRLLTFGDCYFVPEILSYFRLHGAQASIYNNFANWFDEYNFYKWIKTDHLYKVRSEELNIDRTIKRTALRSASAMYQLLPRLQEKKNRMLFLESFKIVFKERVISKSLLIYLFKRKKTKHPKELPKFS